MKTTTLCLILATVTFAKLLAGGAANPTPKASTCGYEACPKAEADKLNVHIVPHSHDDVGWNRNVDQYFYEDVQHVISTVVMALKLNPDRKFIQVETAYFKSWWENQNNETRNSVIDLVNNGQFEIINAAWSMNDEAAVHYQSTIDQYTIGFRYLEDRLGKCARTKVAWQIDPFGHSREEASLSAQFGFDSFFFSRLDYRDYRDRKEKKTMDLMWRGTANLGDTSDIFTSNLYNHYNAPSNFCFDIECSDTPIIDDEDSTEYNYDTRVSDFAKFLTDVANVYPTNNILITMGGDFKFQAALSTYQNLDLLIKGLDRFEHKYNNKTFKAFYSTPSCYTKAVNEFVNENNYYLELKDDDFMPYADSKNGIWTGFYTSRPASKRFERLGNNLLQVVKQLGVFGKRSYNNDYISPLREILGVMQHHDAITGTEKQGVANNYHILMTRAFERASYIGNWVLSRLIEEEDNDGLDFDSCLLANVSYCEQSDSDKFTVAVYNPLSRPVTSPVNLPVNSENWKITDPDGDEVAHQIVPVIRDFSYITDIQPSLFSLVFSADDLPQLGYKVYQIEKVDADKETKHNLDRSKQTRFGYDDTSFELDDDTGLLKSVTMNGISVDVSQDFLYYSSRDNSGAYVFAPTSDGPTRIAGDSKVTTTPISGDVFEGVVQEFDDWAKQIIKVYKNDPTFIELDWVVGPIDVSGGVGREVISRFTTSLATDKVFYTDSNGRELIKRTRNHRPTYEYTDDEPVSGNYYPVDNRIVLKDDDKEIEFAVLTDRAEGGSSLADGQVELMVHRACHHDDNHGVGEVLNEKQYDQGIVVRGQHYLVLGPKSGNSNEAVGQKSIAALQRDVAQRKHLAPWTYVTKTDVSTRLKKLKYSGITKALSDNAHILTLEPWNDNQLLIRLEHILELNEDENLSKDVTVDLTDLFTDFKINKLEEMTLGGNIPLNENVKLEWPVSEKVELSSKYLDQNYRLQRDDTDLAITLAPMQIRTFIASITYNDD